MRTKMKAEDDILMELVEGQVCPCALRPGHQMEVGGQLKASGTHWIGAWVGPRRDLDAVERRRAPAIRAAANPVAKGNVCASPWN
jgi:hypothetical protein